VSWLLWPNFPSSNTHSRRIAAVAIEQDENDARRFEILLEHVCLVHPASLDEGIEPDVLPIRSGEESARARGVEPREVPARQEVRGIGGRYAEVERR